VWATRRGYFRATALFGSSFSGTRARRALGVVRLVLSGSEPAKIPVSVIDGLKSRERDGYVVLPQPPALKRGDKVQVFHGALAGHLAMFEGMKPRRASRYY
jgi:hypothetical protein